MTQSPEANCESTERRQLVRRIQVNYGQAKQLLEFFGGVEGEVVVAECSEGHSGPGLYVWCEDHPEEGASFLGSGGFACENAPDYNNIARAG